MGEWYWDRQGELYGPLSTEEIDKLIKHHKIGPLDRVRIGEQGEWIAAAEVILRLQSDLPEDSAAKAAANVLSKRKHTLGRGGATALGGPSPLARLLDTVQNLLSGFLAAVLNLAVGKQGKVVLSTTMVLVFSWIVLRSTILDGPSVANTYSRLQELCSEIQLLKEMAGDEGTTRSRLEGLRQELRSISSGLGQAVLSQSHDPSDLSRRSLRTRARRDLLEVSQHALPDMLDSLSSPSAMEFHLTTYAHSMHRVNEYLHGPNGYLGSDRAISRSRLAGQSKLTTTVLIIDGMLVAGVGYWWLSRRKAAA